MKNNPFFDSMENSLNAFAKAFENITSQPQFIKSCSDAINQMGSLAQPNQWTEQALLGRKARVEATPFSIAWRSGASALRYYAPEQRDPSKVLFISYAMVNRPYILDLLPERSVIRNFLNNGYGVYLLDWGEPTRTEADMPLSSFIQDTLGGAIEVACKKENRTSIPVLGYCQGGTLALEYALKNPSKLESLILLATPVDFSKLGQLSLWSSQFQPESFLNPDGNVSGWKIRMAFENMRPFHVALRWQTFTKKMLEGEAGEVEKEHFAAMERWIADDKDIPGRAFIEFVREYYHKNNLLSRLSSLSIPVLCAGGEKDHLVPPESTWAIFDHAKSAQIKGLRCDCGHIGLSVSGKAHKELWPQMMKWIEKTAGK